MISIIVPNYNGVTLLKKNLPSIVTAIEWYDSKHNNACELIVIDDCSVDESLQFLETVIPTIRKKIQVTLIKNIKNEGFSPTINKAVKQAKGEYVILLNSDVSPQREFLLPLLRHFDNEEIFAVGCLDKSIEDKKTVLRGAGIGYWEKGLFLHKAGNTDTQYTFWVSAGSGAFRKKTWELLGGLSEIYAPFYWEDIDISYRAMKAGKKVIFEKESVVIHEHEKGAIKENYNDGFIKKISYRNQFIFIWKNITEASLLLSHIVWLPYHILKALMRGDFVFIQGFFLAFFTLPKIIQCSFKERRTFRLSDKELLQQHI